MERKLTAILCADVYGYSRLMGEDEEATLRTLTSHRKLIDSQIENHHGRFVNSAGDSVLAEFASVVEAVNCAVEIQNVLRTENANSPSERRMEFRIGINLGDVIVEGEQIYGDGLNVAARLESLADPGGICISGTAHDQVRDKLALDYEDRGDQAVKNIARPVRVWRVVLNGTAAAPRARRRIARRYWHAGIFSLGGLALMFGTIVIVQHLSLKPPRPSASISPHQKSALPLPDQPSIAVLPFVNLSRDPEQEYFSDGITDDLTTDLSRLPGLFVIARNSSFTYKGKSARLQDVGNELGVKYVLQGSVRKAGGEVRVTVQLADASTGAELWAERYDRPMRDIFPLQDEIVRRIVTTANLQLNLAQQGFAIPRSTENLEAYDDLLHGLEYAYVLTRDGNAKARQMFEKALASDPKYAMAYAALGENYFLGLVMATSPDPNSAERALKFEQQAIALDDSLALAHSLLGAAYLRFGQSDRALAEVERGVALDPNSAGGYLWLAQVLIELGKPEEALTAINKAIRLDPRATDVYLFQQGEAYSQLGRWHEAISSLKANEARYPGNLWSHVNLAQDYAALGDKNAAQAELAEVERVVTLEPNSAPGNYALADSLNSTGRPAQALAATEKAMRLGPGERTWDFEEGWALSQLGRWQDSISSLNRLPASNSSSLWPHVWRAVDDVELGRDDAARAEVAEVLKINPQFSLKIGIAAFPANEERAAADLHKAGLN